MEISIKELDRIYDDFKDLKGNAIPLLQEVQETFGYIPEDGINYLADRLGVPRSRFFGVATFYAQFYLAPRGKNIVTACSGTACHVKGSDKIIRALRMHFGLGETEATTSDRQFTLEAVNCVGACSIAPVVLINKKVYGKAASDKIIKEIKALGKPGGSSETEKEDE